MVAMWYVGLHVVESVGRQLTFEIKTISYQRKTKTTVLFVNVNVDHIGQPSLKAV